MRVPTLSTRCRPPLRSNTSLGKRSPSAAFQRAVSAANFASAARTSGRSLSRSAGMRVGVQSGTASDARVGEAAGAPGVCPTSTSSACVASPRARRSCSCSTRSATTPARVRSMSKPVACPASNFRCISKTSRSADASRAAASASSHWLGAAAQPPTLFQTRPATAWQPTLVRLPPHPGAHLLLPAKAVPTGLPPTMRTTWRGHHCRLQRSLNSRVLELPACPRTTREQEPVLAAWRPMPRPRALAQSSVRYCAQRRPDQGIEVRIAVGRPPIDGKSTAGRFVQDAFTSLFI